MPFKVGLSPQVDCSGTVAVLEPVWFCGTVAWTVGSPLMAMMPGLQDPAILREVVSP